MKVKLYCGDCLDILPKLKKESVDAIITDPPYPCIKRDYGMLTEAEWWVLMVEGVVPQVRRVLKPTGSAVFILQPNSKHVGQMRGWLWEFMAWVCREWNMVQDVWWWNYTALPLCGANTAGLTRPSVKACVWCGRANCYRNQNNVLLSESVRSTRNRVSYKMYNRRDARLSVGSIHQQKSRLSTIVRGGVTPFNLLKITHGDGRTGAGAYGHGAGTPLKLADWWTRYICPPGGTVLDPFVGSGTMMLAAIKNKCNGIGIDKEARYIEIAQKRIKEKQSI